MRRKEKRNKRVYYGVGALAAVLSAVILFLVIGKVFGGERKTETTAMPEAAVLSGDEIVSEIENESASEEQSLEEEETSVEDIPIAAEVAEVNDTEDPQGEKNENGAGAEVDVTTLDTQDNAFETSGMTFGVDVAKYQGTIDWEQVKAAGAEFAMIRVGYRTQKTGIIYEDPTARYNLQQAQAAGIKLGAYFFSTAINEEEAREEAAWVTNFISQYKITYPVAYNCEGFLAADSRQFFLSRDVRTANAAAFLDYVRAKGYTPMFYASKNEMENNVLWNMDILGGKNKVWVSQYPAEPYPATQKSSYAGTHAMWQHTNQGQVPGIPKKVDLNIAYFGYTQEAEAKDNTPPEIVEADPEVGILFTEVNEEVTAKIETNLRTVPSTSDPETVVAKLKNGETAVRTGVGNNGWSRVTYNGQKLYAVSSYLTAAGTPAPASEETEGTAEPQEEASGEEATEQSAQAPAGTGETFQEVNEAVTAKNSTNLRTEPSTKNPDSVAGQLNYGTVVTRTGISATGWSRLDVDGVTLYAVSNYLTTDMNYPETSRPTVDNPESATTFRPVNEQVTAKIETNLRSVPSTESDDTVIAKLKNGETLQRTGIADNGWSRLNYNGQNVYAVSSYLIIAQ